MDPVEEIEAAINRLSPEQFRRIAAWFHALEQAQWDKQMDQDSSDGKLDFLFEEAERESHSASQWPPQK